MRIVVTVREVKDMGIWEEVCELKHYNVWAVNEGLMDSDDEIELDSEDCAALGIRMCRP